MVDRRGAATFVGVALIAVALIVSAVPALADDDDDGNLTVVIVDDSPSPTPSPTSSGSPTPRPSSSGGGSNPQPADTPIPTPSPTSTPGSDGLLQLSGITGVAWPSADPGRGVVHASLTIRNASSELIAGRVEFRLEDPFGGPLGHQVRLVFALEPDETRDLTLVLVGPAQWPLVQVTGLVTSLADADGDEIDAVYERDVWLLSFPWLIAIILVLLIVAASWIYALRRTRGSNG